MMKRGRRVSPDRRERTAHIAARIKAAIEHEPLLRRLPGEAELAELLRVPIRTVRYALASLAEAGWLKATRGGGHRVVRTLRHVPPLQGIVLAHSRSCRLLAQYLALAADYYCRAKAFMFTVQTVCDETGNDHLSTLTGQTPGRHTGWIICGWTPAKDLLVDWLAERRRFVLVEKLHGEVAAPAVLLDLAGAIPLAIDHLHSLGHQHVALAASSCGLEGDFARHGLDLMSDWQLDLPSAPLAAVSNAVRLWLDRWKKQRLGARPTAVVVRYTETARIFLDVCRAAGVDVPTELSVIGLGCEFGRASDLPLTLASSGNVNELAEAAIDLLADDDRLGCCALASTRACLCHPGVTVANRR